MAAALDMIGRLYTRLFWFFEIWTRRYVPGGKFYDRVEGSGHFHTGRLLPVYYVEVGVSHVVAHALRVNGVRWTAPTEEIFVWLRERHPPGRYRVIESGIITTIAFRDQQAAFEFKMRWG